MVDFLFDGPDDAPVTVLLGHGAGAPMDSAAMATFSRSLAGAGLRVVRFEFAYMAGRRIDGTRKPPPRAEKLIPEYDAAVRQLAVNGPLIIGGKSMGGRVASMVADGLFTAALVKGVLCLGYPFHPVGKPDQTRITHLRTLQTPALIVQGTRDLFGAQDEVNTYDLPENISFLWLEDGDHDLKPRKSISGFSAADHMLTLGRDVARWANALI